METETMESVDFDVFESVTIELSRGPLQGQYPTHINRVQRTRLDLRVPRTKRLYLPIGEDEIFTFRCTRPGGTYECQMKIEQRLDQGSYPILVIPRPAKMKRIQYRKDVRVPCEIETTLWELESGTEKIKRGPMRVTMVDISAGGMKIHSEERLEQGAEVVMDFPLPLIDQTMETIFAEVLRCFDEKVGNQFVSALTFRGLTSQQEDNIIKYAYKRQIELKKEGRWRQS